MGKLKLWTTPKDYMGAEYPDYYVVPVGRTRDSGLLEQSNFESALKMLGGESDTVITPSASHWAVGWVQPLLVHKDDAKAVAKAQEIADSLADYPVLDDEDYSNREQEAAYDNTKEAARIAGYDLSEAEVSKVLAWLEDNKNAENIDDTGYWPSDEDLAEAVKAVSKKPSRKGRKTKSKRETQGSLGGMRY